MSAADNSNLADESLEGTIAPGLLDTRPERDFRTAHHPAAASIPLEQLMLRLHELPPPGASVEVVDADSARTKRAADFLRQRRYRVTYRLLDPAELTSTGATQIHLWQPSPFLVEAMNQLVKKMPRCSDQTDLSDQSSEAIDSLNRPNVLCASDRPCALDVACGSGREAVWLAMNGWQVDAIDLLPDALEKGRNLASRWHVSSRVRFYCCDLEQLHVDKDSTFAIGPCADSQRLLHVKPSTYDLVMGFRYLHRPLMPVLAQLVRPNGYLIYETFHQRTAEMGLKPRSPDHVLNDGELAGLFPSFQPMIARDAVLRDGRWFSQLLARRA
ncbi:MAG: methyltransferase domain-containing protein [Phycisphaerales bacterium]|nr:methyltransferase domain-containing protein [Phycisphaerales bacterium]